MKVVSSLVVVRYRMNRMNGLMMKMAAGRIVTDYAVDLIVYNSVSPLHWN